MKQTERDIKYIIKRILIGVGIALILFNLKKCNVYAESSVRTFQLTANNVNAYWQYSSNDISSCNNYANSLQSFEYNDIKYNICYSAEFSKKYFIAFEYENQPYVLYGSSNFDTYNNALHLRISSGSTTGDNMQLLLNNGTRSMAFGYRPIFNQNPNSLINVDTDENITSSNVSKLTGASLYENNNYEKLHMIYNNYGLPLYINDTYEVPPVPDDPLANYTQLDLTGYQAVLLVPKNYQTMLSDSSHTNENPPGVFRTYLDLEYYSQECVRGTLINVENVQDIMLNNIGVGTGSIAESVTGTCYSEPTQTIMSYEFDQYSGLKARGLLIYNGSQDWQSGFGTETPFFGTSYVWYNPDLYNAYLVESFDNFNQTISYKDYSGTDKEVKIKSLPTFTESMQNAIENVDSPTPTEVNKQKIQAIFQFLKSPFSFLNKLNTTSCTPIDLPFPRSNQNIHFECLSSSVYDRYLPTALKSIIIIIINGLLFYRCTLSNIDIFTDILDPEDNKLEAVQL